MEKLSLDSRAIVYTVFSVLSKYSWTNHFLRAIWMCKAKHICICVCMCGISPLNRSFILPCLWVHHRTSETSTMLASTMNHFLKKTMFLFRLPSWWTLSEFRGKRSYSEDLTYLCIKSGMLAWCILNRWVTTADTEE